VDTVRLWCALSSTCVPQIQSAYQSQPVCVRYTFADLHCLDGDTACALDHMASKLSFAAAFLLWLGSHAVFHNYIQGCASTVAHLQHMHCCALQAEPNGNSPILTLEQMTKYCESVYQTKRRPTRTVWAGKVPIGSEHRIARQTMTTTDTRDVAATVDQVRPSF
jgi:hypothetical protein